MKWHYINCIVLYCIVLYCIVLYCIICILEEYADIVKEKEFNESFERVKLTALKENSCIKEMNYLQSLKLLRCYDEYRE